MRYSEWSRYDESGVNQTCPLIDDVISIIHDSDLDNKKEAIELLEKIRSDNERLRKWGSETNYQLSEALDEIRAMENQIEELESKTHETA